jgi:hypothetical protein
MKYSGLIGVTNLSAPDIMYIHSEIPLIKPQNFYGPGFFADTGPERS